MRIHFVHGKQHDRDAQSQRLNSSSRSALDVVCHLGQAIISSGVPSIKKIDYL